MPLIVIKMMPSLDDFAHLRIPLEDILSATNNFAEENVIRKSEFAKNYKGLLLWFGELIEVDARRLNKDLEDGEHMSRREIFLLSTLKHKNLVSLVGFCDENDEKVIITRRATRGSLSQYLSDPMLLTWVRRLEICVGIAHALSYIHYVESNKFGLIPPNIEIETPSSIHLNIDSETVLLNNDWEPKLSFFESFIEIKASKRHHSFNNVNHKSADIRSFGILLFEVLCGRESVMMAPYRYNHKTLDEVIDWDLRKQIDSQSFDIFTKTAYDCCNEEQLQCPYINEIVTRLEQALEHQKAIL